MDRDREFREAAKQALRKLLEKSDLTRAEMFDGFGVSQTTRLRIMQKLVSAGCATVDIGTGGTKPTRYSVDNVALVKELLQDDVALTRILWPTNAAIVPVEEMLDLAPAQAQSEPQGESSESQAPGADLSESIDMLGRAMAGCLGLLKAMSDRLDGIEGTVNALLKEWQGGRA